MRSNERGISLVEVLVTITVLSIVGILVWQIFFQGYRYSNDAVSKNLLQQEANIMTTKLTRVHQSYEEYTIKSSNGIVELLDTNNNRIAIFNSVQYKYEVSSNEVELISQQVIPSDKNQNLKITVKITDRNNDKNAARLTTLLYRLKDGEI